MQSHNRIPGLPFFIQLWRAGRALRIIRRHQLVDLIVPVFRDPILPVFHGNRSVRTGNRCAVVSISVMVVSNSQTGTAGEVEQVGGSPGRARRGRVLLRSEPGVIRGRDRWGLEAELE